MSYLHEMIIYYISKVVGRVAIGLHENLVINHIVVEYDFAMNKVLPLAHSVRHEHPHYMLLSARQPLLDLRITQVITEAIVLRRLMLLSALLKPKLLKPFRSAEAVVSFSFLSKSLMENSTYKKQLLDKVLIVMKPLRLHVWS